METKESRSFSDLKSLKEFRFAKALFDNRSESEDELEFKRGDVLTVLSHNPKSMIGWWLCVNHSDGRTGLAPANRLRAIPLPTCDAMSSHRLASNSCCALSDMASGKPLIEDTTRRRSWNTFSRELQSNYDIPVNRQNFGSNVDLYDIPSRNNNNTYDIPISITRAPLLSASSESSDEIRCDSSCHLSDDSVRKRLSDEEMAEYSSDSIELEAIRSVYSIPNKRSFGDLYDIPSNNRSIHEQQTQQTLSQDYDFPKSSDISIVWNNQCLESLSETEIKCLQILEQIFKNFCFGTNWRSREAIGGQQNVSQLQLLCNDLSLFLQQFVTLCNRSVLFGRTHTSDTKMVNKLDQMVRQLNVSLNIVENCLKSMDTKNSWTVDRIVRTESDVVADDLDRLTACAKHISDDIRHIVAIIRGNTRLLFPFTDSPNASPPMSVVANKPPIAPKPPLTAFHRRQVSNTQLRPLPALPVIETEVENEYNDYEDVGHDYVCLESKNEVILQNIKSNEKSDKELEKEKDVDKTEVKAFYFQQMRNCCQFLHQTISELIDLIQKNQFQLTKVSLLTESKSVVICGQKLVFVGQTLVRNSGPESGQPLNESINHLSNSLKAFVTNVRKACLTGRSFPTNQSVETVYESLIEISVLGNQLTRSSL